MKSLFVCGLTLVGLFIAFIIFAQINTRPQTLSSERFVLERDLEIAFIGDSLATDMVRSYEFWTDVFRLATSTRQNAITAHESQENPLGLLDWISIHRPTKITNYSRPAADVFARDFLKDPPAWQRWAINIPSLRVQTDRFLGSQTHPDIIAIWTGHVELLYWNSFQGQFRGASNDEVRKWVSSRYISEFETQLLRLIKWCKDENAARDSGRSSYSIIVYGLLDWHTVTRLSDEVQKLKALGSSKFAVAEERRDPEGQIELWRSMNDGLRGLVAKHSNEFEGLHGSLTYSAILESIDLTVDDIASDGIHAEVSGQRKIAKLLSEGLKKNLPKLIFDR